jgi:hypothetical protein
MLIKPAMQRLELKARRKRTILEVDSRNVNLLVSTGLKFTRVSIDDSSSEYSFSVSDDLPRTKQLLR